MHSLRLDVGQRRRDISQDQTEQQLAGHHDDAGDPHLALVLAARDVAVASGGHGGDAPVDARAVDVQGRGQSCKGIRENTYFQREIQIEVKLWIKKSRCRGSRSGL